MRLGVLLDMRIGSLFSGYGGLDLAVQHALGGQVAWHVEYEKAPSRILHHHYPDIPNHGDVTNLDFTSVEPVDVLTGGYPCQPFSHAGLRKGTDDDRHLWPHVLRAIGEMGPRLVILENVRGHLSMGFDVVLADLASIGWSAEWAIVRASDVGACHQRARLFIVAYPERERHNWRRGSGAAEKPQSWRPDVARLADTPADSSGERHGQGQDAGMVGRLGATAESSGRQASAARSQPSHRGPADATDADHTESQGRQSAARRDLFAWGDYGDAIARWERVIGRPAPAPTEPGRTGNPRLSPAFVEWMMGLPAGWVTDPAIGISRNAQLAALGNGVVPQQAAMAITALLARCH